MDDDVLGDASRRVVPAPGMMVRSKRPLTMKGRLFESLLCDCQSHGGGFVR